MASRIVVIAHDIRSCHNVGALLRTAEGLGVQKIYLSGFTPYPLEKDDKRLPHIGRKADRDIHKTALGAENLIAWQHISELPPLLAELRQTGFIICGLEQASDSTPLPAFRPPPKIALLLGREVEGIEPALLEYCDTIVEIPMRGNKESFNVVQAAAMALYHLTFSKHK